MGNQSTYLKSLPKAAFLIVCMMFLTFISTNSMASLRHNSMLPTASLTKSSLVNTTPAFTVRGQVSDANGALSGVSVTEKGTNNGTTTNEAGNYYLNVSGPNAVLVFSYVGYATREVNVAGQSVINLTLEDNSRGLEGVVVTALGIKREEKALGYSVGKLDGKDLTKVTHENVLTALAGRVPGVAISQAGGAGSSVSMIIRGATSLTGDNQPLFVVDGVPVANSFRNIGGFGDRVTVDFGNAISSLNPEDIASITILKGPSAAALYGSRAGSGVVVITTKSGRKSQGLGISFNSNTVFDQPYKYLPLLTSRFASGERPYTPDNNPDDVLTINTGSSAWVGPELDKGYSAVQWNSPLDASGNPIPIPLVSYKDNAKNFMQTGITSTNTLALTNATDNMNYRISYSNMSNRGMLPNTDLFRNSLNLSTAYNLTKKFVISADVNLVRDNSNNRPSVGRGANPMDALAYLNPGINIMDLKNYWVEGKEDLQQLSPSPGDIENPWFLAYQVINNFTRNRLFGNVRADWQLTDHLSFMARYGMDAYNEGRETKIAKSYSRVKNGVYGLSKFNNLERNTDVLLTYKNRFGEFDLNTSAGGNIMYQKYSSLSTSTNSGGLIIPGLYNLSNVLPSSLVYGSYLSQKSIYSLYGLASLGFKNAIYLDLTARNDWSSTLPVENRSYFYPSASLSVLLNNLLSMPQYVSLLKLRGGWAQVGKDTGPYSLYPVTGNAGAWGDLTRLVLPGTLYNPQLKPEIATSYEYGADLAFFKNRLRFQGTVYQSDNKNQILGISLPNSSGYGSKLINAGLLRSKGIELMMGVTPTAPSSNVQWDLNLNFSKNRTTIVALTPGMNYYVLWSEANGGAWTYVGEEIGNMYGKKLVTVEDKNSPYFGYPILDENGSWQDYGSARENQVKVGNFNPKFTMGLQTSLSYKRVSLTASLDWRNGGQFISQTYRYTESDLHSERFLQNTIKYFGDQAGLPQFLKDHASEYITDGVNIVGGPTKELGGFTHTEGGITLNDGVFEPGVIEITDADGNFLGYQENLGGPGTKYIRYQDNYPWSFNKSATFDASYVKLREVSLNYDLPTRFVKRVGLQNAMLGVFSRDIIIWTKAKIGIDPERAFQPSAGRLAQGVEFYNNLPWVIPVGIKLSVNF